MSEVDYAKLKRLLAAVGSALERVPEKSAHGLPATYNALREQIVAAVPEGLRDEASKIAPEVTSSVGRTVIEDARRGAAAYAHLAALYGWLKAVTDGA